MSLNNLPSELLIEIFSYIPQNDLVNNVSQVCSRWDQLCQSSTFWRTVDCVKTYKNTCVPLKHLYKIKNFVKHLTIPTKWLQQIQMLFNYDVQFFSLKTLEFSPNSYIGSTTEDLVEIITYSCPRVTSITLYLPPILEVDSMNKLSRLPLETVLLDIHSSNSRDDIISLISKLPRLRKLILQGIQPAGVYSLITNIINGFPNLTNIDMQFECNNVLNDVFASSTEPLQLRELCVKDRMFDNAGLLSLAQRAQFLSKLDLEKCQYVTDHGFIHLAEYCPLLESISFGKDSGETTGISNTGLSALADRCPLLRKVSAKNCPNIDDDGVILIAKSCPSLVSITLHECGKVTDESLYALAEHCKLLCEADFGGCLNITAAGGISLLRSCKRLTTLYLCSCDDIED